MKPSVALFKKNNKKLCQLSKAKIQNLINSLRCLHQEKDVNKTVKRKIGEVRVFYKFVLFLI